jgi:hypothetical protein
MFTRHTLSGFGLFALLSLGCSHSEPSSTTPDPDDESEPVAEVEAVPEPEPEPEPTAPGMYFADLTAVTPEPFPAFTAAIDTCRNPDDGECTLKRTAGFDTRRNHWAVFDVDPGELAPGDAWLGTVTATEQHATFEGRVERRRVAAIRRGLGTFRTVTPGQNLVTHATQEVFSIMQYNALVALGGELEGWAMWIEASEQNGGYVLHMLRRIRPTPACWPRARRCALPRRPPAGRGSGRRRRTTRPARVRRSGLRARAHARRSRARPSASTPCCSRPTARPSWCWAPAP